jgi:hypothetical protein
LCLERSRKKATTGHRGGRGCSAEAIAGFIRGQATRESPWTRNLDGLISSATFTGRVRYQNRKGLVNAANQRAFWASSACGVGARGDLEGSLSVPALRLRRRGQSRMVVTWLILPVVICLSQRLSHACLSVNNSYETANGSLNQLSFI